MHFLVRLLLKGFFPLRQSHTLSQEQINNIKANYGFKTIGVVLAASLLIFTIIQAIVEAGFKAFYPGEKNGCFYCYDNAAIIQIALAIPLAYILIKKMLHSYFKTDYEDVKMYLSVTNGFNAPKVIKTALMLFFLLGAAISYLSKGGCVAFCKNDFESKNFSTDTKGDTKDQTIRYSYKDIEGINYRYSRYESDSTSTYFKGITLYIKNGDKIALDARHFGEGSNNVRDRVITRIMTETGFTAMDTIDNAYK